MKTQAYELKPLNIPLESSLRREPPRPVEHRQDNYEELFDYKMLFADIFVDNGKLVAVGAPPLNLEPLLDDATYLLNGSPIAKPVIEHRSLCAVYHFDVEAQLGDILELSLMGERLSGEVQANRSDFFHDCDVLIAVQKDNDIEWIAYWALHHSLVSGINSILLYDNGSKSYSCDQLRSVLSEVPGIERVMICSSDCPFGPTGGPAGKWDSNFGQLIHYEHARRFALREARTVLVNDIDEIIGTDRSETVVEKLLRSTSSALGVQRLNVINYLRDGFTESDVRAHNVYGYVRKGRPQVHGKYVAKVARLPEEAQFNVHLIRNTKLEKADSQEMICGNFVGVSKTWRTGKFDSRKNIKSKDNLELEIEPLLTQSMDSISDDWEALLEVLHASGHLES